MNILIVGNVVKDTYLNLDSRVEHLETDKNGTRWLDLSFDASIHKFYNHHVSLGGAAISLEVLSKMGLSAKISGCDLHFSDSTPSYTKSNLPHRYILVVDESVSYFSPSVLQTAQFSTDDSEYDYIYIDRSASPSTTTCNQIVAYLNAHPTTKLALYLPKSPSSIPVTLRRRASLIFSESSSARLLNFDKTVFISDREIAFRDHREPIRVERIDRLTHLSAYSIAAATILGGLLLSKSPAASLKMARANLENSTLDSVLSLRELDSLASLPSENLELTAASLVVPKKGILAADESGGSINKKFANLGIPDTFANRHDYRNLFFTTPNLEQYLSGVILFDETARDHAKNGQTYTDFLISRRLVPGIKVDQGLAPLKDIVPGHDLDETYTKGLDDLPSRLREYYTMGLRFAKWRAAFNLTHDADNQILTPSTTAITENSRILAEYALRCQSAGIVPIVEPELVHDGDYTITECAETTARILDSLFQELKNFGINLRACLLKVNMVLAGKKAEKPSTPEEVGHATAAVLKNHVPAELAGVVFLSGGQTPEQSTANLAAVTQNGPFPWPVTFSFARALQDPLLYAWKGDNTNATTAQNAFHARLVANQKALNSYPPQKTPR